MTEKLNSLSDECFRHVTLRQLRVLAMIAAKGRVGAAANALGVTAPAVTQQLALLEAAAGLPLFERSRQGLRLTDAGRHLLGAHGRMEMALRDAAALCNDIKGLGRGRVALGAVSTAKYLAPYLIAAFARRHPNLDVRLTVGNRQEILASLEQLDIAIMGNPPPDLDVERHVIGRHPHVIVAPVDHPLTRLKHVPPARLAGETFLQREIGSGTRALMERTFATLEIKPRTFSEFGGNETIKQAVIAGLGIAFVSAQTVTTEIMARLLSVLPVEGLPIVREWYAVRLRGRQQSPASMALWEFVTTRGPGLIPDPTDLVTLPNKARARLPDLKT
ncbi:MAG: LysR substrate-binding domain-containing protein [Hyphomicrobium sp.]